MRLFRNSVPGPDTHSLILIIEYADMAAYDARTCFENESAEWQRLFGNQADSPELLRSVQLLTEFHP
ncbi:MAG: hypothetical protein ABI300_08505 [Rhodanobacter sp.]